MATIHKEVEINRSEEFVWDAVRDVGNIHKRLVPGFVVDCRLEGDWRTVTFANGIIVRELIVSVDDETRRHSWAAQGESLSHYNASVQVFPAGKDKCRVVWIADLMPNEAAEPIGNMIQQGLETMKRTLESKNVNEFPEQLVNIERKLWTNDAVFYKDNLTEDCLLVFPETGVISRAVAVEAIRKENEEGRRWAEVYFDEIRSLRLIDDVALLNYRVKARWEHKRSAITALASSLYVKRDNMWKLTFHQQTPLTQEPDHVERDHAQTQ